MAAAVASGIWRTSPDPQILDLKGVRALRFRPPGGSRGVVLHLHGGGFRLGCPELAAPFAAALAARCGVEVVLPAYRLAPEHPFPAGLVDAERACSALLELGAGPLILSGDSAGGGLAAVLAGLTRGQQRVRGLVTLSAWLDLRVTAPSYVANKGVDALFSRAAALDAADLYLQGHPADDPLVSPLLDSLSGYPPTFVSVGAGEVLLDDSLRFHAALEAASVSAALSVVPDMEHTAVVRSLTAVGAAETLDAVSAYLDQILARPD